MNQREKITALITVSMAISIFMVLYALLMVFLILLYGPKVIGIGTIILSYLSRGMDAEATKGLATTYLSSTAALGSVTFLLFLVGYFMLVNHKYRSLPILLFLGNILLIVVGGLLAIVGIFGILGAIIGFLAPINLSKILKEAKHGVPEKFIKQKVSRSAVVAVFFINFMLILSAIVLLVVPTLSAAQFKNLSEVSWKEAGVDEYIPAQDTDHDGLSDIKENYLYGTNLTKWDSDGDNMPDGWEALYAREDPLTHKLHPDPNTYDPFDNPDGDAFDYSRFIFISEFTLGSSKKDAGRIDTHDWNGDGVTDFYINTTQGSYKNEIKPDQGKYGEIVSVNNLSKVVDIMNFWDDENLTNFKEFFISVLMGYPLVFKTPEDYASIRYSLNPSSPDTDRDGIDDGYESFFWLWSDRNVSFPNMPMFDESDEEQNKTARAFYAHRMSPLDPTDAVLDYDRDRLLNIEEYLNGTYPIRNDTDQDGLFDNEEFAIEYPNERIKHPDPTNPDTDGDKMPDGWEYHHGLNPCNSSDQFTDPDHDGLQNWKEFSYPTWDKNYWIQDYNGNGRLDKSDYKSCDPFNPDTDGDGMGDGWEAFNAMETKERPDIIDGVPVYSISISPLIDDAYNDVDYRIDENGYMHWFAGDGLTNIEEYYFGTDPNNPDTDGDNLDPNSNALNDGGELKTGFHGELIGDIYYTLNFSAIYHTNASSMDSDMDSNKTNASRHLYDWEEINGIQYERIDGIDNDGDGQVDEADEGAKWEPTNASNPDSDIDGIPDEQEIFGFYWNDPLDEYTGWIVTDPTNKDSDFDGLKDREEIHPQRDPHLLRTLNPTNPMIADSDNDGLLDGLEVKTDFYPYIDPDKLLPYLVEEGRFQDNDDDNDGKLNEDGGYDGINLDHDNYTDEDPEDDIDFTDPRNPDTDGDGMPDGWEATMGANLTKFGPGDKDYALEWIVNPLNPFDKYDDPDHDGLTNYEEYKWGCDPLNNDTDGDGLPDGWEVKYAAWVFFNNTNMWGWNLDPANPDSDLDGIPDGDEDYDNDGYHYQVWDRDRMMMVWVNLTFNNTEEYLTGTPDIWGIRHNGTDPNDPDTDNDNMPDGWEIYLNDPDDDRMPNGYEKEMAAKHPDKAEWFDTESNDTNSNGINDGAEDWDGDGQNNSWEAAHHTDCLDSNNYTQFRRSVNPAAVDPVPKEEGQKGQTCWKARDVYNKANSGHGHEMAADWELFKRASIAYTTLSSHCDGY